MDSWNVYSQNPSGTPGTAWLCPQNNTQGSDWLHPQNNSTERERNENTALATPTRYIMELNDLNQNSSSNSYFDRLFEHNFLKLGNQEDLLNNGVNGVYSNEDFSSFLNSNLPVTSAPNISVSIPTTTSNIPNDINSPTPSLVTDDGKDQLYNLQDGRLAQYPIATSASFLSSSIPAYLAGNNNQQQQSPTTKSVDENQNISRKMTTPSSNLKNLSPTMVNKSHQREHHQTNYPTTSSSSSFYQSTPVSTLVADNKDLYIQDAQQRMFSSTFDNRDQYLQSKKRDPKQLLLPLTVIKTSMDDTMTVAITSPSSSLDTDDDMDQCDQAQQRKVKTHRQSVYQDFPLSITTNDLPIQQPSPSSSEYFSSGTKSPSSSHETTPKEKKRRALQKKSNSKRTTKSHERVLITPVDESFTDIQEQTTSSTESGESSSITASNVASTTTVSNSDASTSSMSSPSDDHVTLTSCVGIKRNHLDDGQDETPEEKRSRLLERNRIAAAKCRQKKKQAQETLQQQASDLTQKNTGLHSVVNDLREEALRLKNQLLAHSTCNCNVIQEYVRTSGQFAFARPPYTK